MKINRLVEFEWNGDEYVVVHKVSEDYEGPIALCGGGKGAKAPDYTAAAKQTGASNKESLTQQTWANRPTINTPWGQQSWESAKSIDPATGQAVTDWTQNITLSPDQQASLDSQTRVQTGRSQGAEGLLGQATDAFKTPFNWAGLDPQGHAAQGGAISQGGVGGSDYSNRAEQALFQRQMGLLEPGMSQSEDARRTRMANMGIAPEGGSEAWNRGQQSMDAARQQATQQAAYQAVIGGGQEASRMQGMDMNAQNAWNQAQQQDFTQQGQSADQSNRIRQQQIAEEAQRRGMPLNELNALLTGQQVSMPQMPGAPSSTAGNAGGVNYLGAAQAQGQADQAASGGFWGGLGSLAGAGAQMYGMSDIRLKSNIKRIGTHKRGVGIYEYDLFGERTVGVMAQELMVVAPELVAQHPSGFLMVNYGGL